MAEPGEDEHPLRHLLPLAAANVRRYRGIRSRNGASEHGRRVVVNILRRISLARLLLACVLAVVLAASAAALALALGSGPTPPAKPLAQAVHDALAAPPVEGVRANVQLTNRLLEGANLASGNGGEAGQLSQSPLLSGASGRLWIAKDGRVRLELQAEKGDTQVLYDGHTLSVYDAASNTLYRYTPPAHEEGAGSDSHRSSDNGEVPSVAKIEEAIGKLKHATVSGATPTDVAGQPAYTARISPKESGSLIGGAELSWDADNGVPLRAAIYSSTSSAPVIELAASEISFGPVESSVFQFTPPANAKVEEVTLPTGKHGGEGTSHEGHHAKVTTHGSGITAVKVLEAEAKPGEKQPSLPEGLQKVKLDATTTASELPTALGTLLTFERSGVRYVLAGAITPSQIEAVARGL
jgi:outer membrane lipoprotein-sorting protein